MKNSHVRPFCIMLFVCIFALTPILGLTPSVEASQTDEENEVQEIAEPSFEGLLQRIEQLETEGAFKNRGASQSLKAQLQTVIRFEQREDSEQTPVHVRPTARSRLDIERRIRAVRCLYRYDGESRTA